MLDDFDDNEASFSFLDELDDLPEDDLLGAASIDSPKGRFMGMTPRQRFVIALLVFILACILATLCLLVFDKITLPF